jgi:MFS superfamily sulfate permease-like transporter
VSPIWRAGCSRLPDQQQFIAHPRGRSSGARTQLAGVVGALAVAVLLMVAPDLLHNLPTSALAAVVIASAIGLIEVTDLLRIYRIQRWEFWLSIVCTIGVAFGAIEGIGLAIVIAVIEFLWDAWRPYSAVLGRADGVHGFHDIKRYPARACCRAWCYSAGTHRCFSPTPSCSVTACWTPWPSPTPVRWLVVAAEPVTSVDVTSADMLAELHQTLHEAGIELCVAEMKDPVKDKLQRFGLLAKFGESAFFPTVGSAVSHYLQRYPVEHREEMTWISSKPSRW